MLFGFQLATVFSEGFSKLLDGSEQRLHLLAIALVAIAIALIMTPAAYHRQTEPEQVSDVFIRVSTRWLLASMPPLAVAICLDFYLVARVILGNGLLGAGIVAWLAAALLAVFIGLWFVLPLIARWRHWHDR